MLKITPPADFPKQSLCLPGYPCDQEVPGPRLGTGLSGWGADEGAAAPAVSRKPAAMVQEGQGFGAKGLWPGKSKDREQTLVLFSPEE